MKFLQISWRRIECSRFFNDHGPDLSASTASLSMTTDRIWVRLQPRYLWPRTGSECVYSLVIYDHGPDLSASTASLSMTTDRIWVRLQPRYLWPRTGSECVYSLVIYDHGPDLSASTASLSMTTVRSFAAGPFLRTSLSSRDMVCITKPQCMTYELIIYTVLTSIYIPRSF